MTLLANGLADQGHHVDMLLVKATGPYLADLSESVKVIDLHARGTMTGILPLAKYLRAEKPDVLISTLDHANIAAILARRLSGVSTPVIPTVHIPHSKAAAHSTGFRSRMIYVAVKWCYRWADAIVAVSHGTADDIVQTSGVPRELVHVIYNPVITPEIEELAKEPLDHPWFVSGGPKVILGVGRMRPQKDYPTLIQAFALVRKEHDCRLLILGEGGERSRLEQLVSDLGLSADVDLPGFVKNPFAYLARSSLLVLSSAWEALPTVLIEALALDVPIVSTNCRTGPDEILADGRYGRLVPVGDAPAMAGAITDTLRETRSEPPEEHLRQFTLPVAVDEYLKLIAEVIDA